MDEPRCAAGDINGNDHKQFPRHLYRHARFRDVFDLRRAIASGDYNGVLAESGGAIGNEYIECRDIDLFVKRDSHD